MSDIRCPICKGLGVCFDVPCGECEATGQHHDIDDPLGCCAVCLGAGVNVIEECDFCLGLGMIDQDLAIKLLF
jgi:DnaJ-class molecular chaperone